MDIKILESKKDELIVEIGNLTIAEILRVYLNKDDNVSFAAWKRERIESSPVLKVKTKGKAVKKVMQDVISQIEKDLDDLVKNVKSSKNP